VGRTPSDIAPRIVHAARRRFLADGVEGASLRAIAQEARTSIGMIYYYFPTKDDLFLSVVEEIYVGLLEDIEKRLVRTRPVLERVQLLFQRMGTLEPDERDVVRLIIREVLVSPARLDKLIRRFQRGHLPLLFSLVDDAVADGLFRDDLPVSLVLAPMFALAGPSQAILGQLRHRLPTAKVPRAQDQTASLIDVLLHGVGGGKRQRPARRPRSASEPEGAR
jgi:AcrR family transcriptional regulator